MSPYRGRVSRRDHLLWEILDANLHRMAEALERMAAADERRNELIEAESSVRGAAWEESERRQDERLAMITSLPDSDGD